MRRKAALGLRGLVVCLPSDDVQPALPGLLGPLPHAQEEESGLPAKGTEESVPALDHHLASARCYHTMEHGKEGATATPPGRCRGLGQVPYLGTCGALALGALGTCVSETNITLLVCLHPRAEELTRNPGMMVPFYVREKKG